MRASDRVHSEESNTGYISEVFHVALAAFISSCGTGLIAISVAKLIELVQVIGFPPEGHPSECEATTVFTTVFFGGCFGAVAWYWLRGLQNKHFVQVADSIKGAKMRPVVTLINGAIQDIVVALGGSFGREAAPREIAAMWAGEISDFLELKAADRSMLVACGTGAGLAAVYSCPISGILYTIEHTLHWKVSSRGVVLVIFTTVCATFVSSIAVETVSGLYHLQDTYSSEWPDRHLLVYSCLLGVLNGLAALCFRAIAVFAKKKQPKVRLPAIKPEEGDIVWLFDEQTELKRKAVVMGKDDLTYTVRWNDTKKDSEFTKNAWLSASPEGARNLMILFVMPAASFALAVPAIFYPELLGNGAALARAAILPEGNSGYRSDSALFTLFILKALLTLGIIASGAAGGTLTPSVSLGAVMGTLSARSYARYFWTHEKAPLDGMSIISAAAFLSVAMKSPVTTGFLLLEFSAQGVDKDAFWAILQNLDFGPLWESKLALGMLIPIFLAIAFASLTEYCVMKLAQVHRFKRRRKNKFVRTVSAQDMDLVADDDSSWLPDGATQVMCLQCCQAGVIFCTIFMNFSVAAAWSKLKVVDLNGMSQLRDIATFAAKQCYLINAILGASMCVAMDCCRKKDIWSGSSQSASLLADEFSSQETFKASETSRTYTITASTATDASNPESLSGGLDLLSVVSASISAVVGCTFPCMPWSIAADPQKMGQVAKGHWLVAMSVAGSMVCVGLCECLLKIEALVSKLNMSARTLSARRSRKRRYVVVPILKKMSLTLLAAVAGGAAGMLWSHFFV